MSNTAIPVEKFKDALHFDGKALRKPLPNFARGKSIFVTEVGDYELLRSMLYALGARSVSSKMLADVTEIVHGKPALPVKAKAKYPKGTFTRSDAVLPLFHQEIASFGAYVTALQEHGFRVRNASDEGDPALDLFTVPLVGKSLPKTLLRYVEESPFLSAHVRPAHPPAPDREAGYEEVAIKTPRGEVTWYSMWRAQGWKRVAAQRGEGDHPLEIDGEQLLTVLPVLWTSSVGMYLFDQPHVDATNGFFLQAGIDARTGDVHGAAISRVWT